VKKKPKQQIVKANLPYLPVYINDMLGGTANMTAIEFGVYHRLLYYQWQNGAIPLSRVYRVAMAHDKVEIDAVHGVLRDKFIESDGAFYNERLNEVAECQVEKHNVAVKNGKKGGEKRWKDSRANSRANSGANSRANSGANSNSELRTQNSEHISHREAEGGGLPVNYLKWTPEDLDTLSRDINKSAYEQTGQRILTQQERASFIGYWTEPNPQGTPRFHTMKSWDTKRRMQTWARKANQSVELLRAV